MKNVKNVAINPVSLPSSLGGPLRRRHAQEHADALAAWAARCKSAYVVLEEIRSRHGGARRFALSIGVTEPAISRIGRTHGMAESVVLAIESGVR